MLEKRIINLEIGKDLRDRLQYRMQQSDLKEPVPSISWGKWDDEKEERFMIGFYERSRLPVWDPVRLIEADGIEFLIIQDWICDELEGKKLDIVDGELSVF